MQIHPVQMLRMHGAMQPLLHIYHSVRGTNVPMSLQRIEVGRRTRRLAVPALTELLLTHDF
jgi:hypothetical protein